MYTSIYNPYVPQELFLAHHGILGQRWGKRNGPPYPLGAGDHSASEKKAGWRKSLAGGAVKTAKAIGRGTVKTAKAVNKAALRLGIKPKKLMSDEEIAYSINRLKQEKTYQRALRGKFISVEEAERNKGKSAVRQLMGAIGKDVIIPTTTGLLRYTIAEKLGGKAEGEKVASIKETLFNSKGGIGFRNNFFYDSDGKAVFREQSKNKSKKEKENPSQAQSSAPEPKEKPKVTTQAPEPKPKEKPVTKAPEPKPKQATQSSSSSSPKPASPTLTRTQQLNARDVLGPVNTRKNASTIISDANQAYNKAWKQGSGYTLAEGSSKSLSTKVGSLNTLVQRTLKDGTADQVWKKMQDGKYLSEDETRKFRYGR